MASDLHVINVPICKNSINKRTISEKMDFFLYLKYYKYYFSLTIVEGIL